MAGTLGRSHAMAAISLSKLTMVNRSSIREATVVARYAGFRWTAGKKPLYWPESTSSAFLSRRVLFFGGERSAGIEFLNFDTGKISPFFQPERQMTVGLSLAPDQRHVLFPQRESAGSDLMLVENFPERP